MSISFIYNQFPILVMKVINFILLIFCLNVTSSLFSQGSYLSLENKPIFGSIELSKGFDAPFREVEVAVRPSVNIENLNFCVGCEGYLSSTAVIDLHWTGETDQLRIHFEPEKFGTDACLAIYTPTQQWLYVDNMDKGMEGPFMYLYGYDSGMYKIYIGTKLKEDTIAGRLIITESYIPDESIRETADVGLNVGFVPTPHSKVETMLNLVNLMPGDYLIDLGCGDGRIVIEAAKRGAFAHGIDLDPLRIDESWENAKNADVLEKVSFEENNIFNVELSQATIISTYLLDEINEALIPKFFKELQPGTRIVSYSFRMGEWEPDVVVGDDCQKIYLWTVPAQVEGVWSLTSGDKNFKINITQKYQKIEISVTDEEVPLSVNNIVLNGTRISFTVSDLKDEYKYAFTGTLSEDVMTGQVRIQNSEGSSSNTWRATKEMGSK